MNPKHILIVSLFSYNSVNLLPIVFIIFMLFYIPIVQSIHALVMTVMSCRIKYILRLIFINLFFNYCNLYSEYIIYYIYTCTRNIIIKLNRYFN